jgi:hypothetical protein
MKISDNVSYEDVIYSSVAEKYKIDNVPNEGQLRSIILLSSQIIEPLLKVFPDLHINSFFRSETLNKKIGGSKTSQHCSGHAVDLDCNDNARLFSYINSKMNFDQLIWEFGNEKNPAWVHVSYIDNKKNRKSVLVSKLINNKTVYEKYYS